MKMAREAFITPSVVSRLNDKMIPLLVNGPKQEAIRDRYKIAGYPTMIILNADGSEADRHVGYLTRKQVQEWTDGVRAGTAGFMVAKKAWEAAPENPEKISAYAIKLNERGDDAALPLFKKLMTLDPGNKKRLYERALKALSEADRMKKDADAEEAKLLELKRIAADEEVLDYAYGRHVQMTFRAAKAKKDDPEAQKALRAKGIKLIKEYCARFPSNADAHNDLAYYLMEYGDDLPGATRAAERAVALEREPAYLDTLATLYGKQGRRAEALKLQREAVRKDPTNEELRENLKTLEASGR